MISIFRCSVNLCLVFLAFVFSLSVIGFVLIYSSKQEDGSLSKTSGTRVVDTLKFVVVVSRHGNRRSLAALPNESIHWNYGLGELTSNGHVQAYNLGVKVRSLYNGFLSNEYQSEDILASSTSIDRTMMSGELFLAGLYPPTGYQVWNADLRWQPVPLYINSPDVSSVAPEICPRFDQEYKDSRSKFEQDNADSLTSINSFLSQHLGFNVTGAGGFFKVWDALACEDGEGMPLPDWAKDVYPDPMEDLVSKGFIARCAGTPSLIRLTVGTFFEEVKYVMMTKVNGSLTPNRQMYYYSGHDTSIVGLQGLLGIPKSSIIGLVRPSSALIFELHQSSEGHFYVEVLYIDGGSTSLSPRLLDLPECGRPCDLNTLFNITQQFTNITNYEQECQLSITDNL